MLTQQQLATMLALQDKMNTKVNPDRIPPWLEMVPLNAETIPDRSEPTAEIIRLCIKFILGLD